MSPLVSAILFAVVANPGTYKLTRSIGGDWIASSDGAAKIGGLILHAIVFVILSKIVYGVLMKKKSGYQYASQRGWGGAAGLAGSANSEGILGDSKY